jgi:PhzF family phenazine biosynthesis protein
MKIRLYQVDAFSDRLFHGNPAAICPLAEWPSDEILQLIAAENNLSETGYYVRSGDHCEIRWFTPTVEVDLCGHATLAAAHVLFNHEGHEASPIVFTSKSGILKVARDGDFLVLDFPADIMEEVTAPAELIAGMGLQPRRAFRGRSDFMLVYSSEKEIVALKPDFARIASASARGVIATARGSSVDFVSRFFAPQFGIDEDPVTGSAHTTLTPYWAGELGKSELTAIQLSSRRGALLCRLRGDRVEIAGQARTYLIGHIDTE